MAAGSEKNVVMLDMRKILTEPPEGLNGHQVDPKAKLGSFNPTMSSLGHSGDGASLNGNVMSQN